MPNTYYKRETLSKNSYFNDTGDVVMCIEMFWKLAQNTQEQDMPRVKVKEVDDVPVDAEEMSEQDFNDVAESISTYSRIGSRPPGLPPH